MSRRSSKALRKYFTSPTIQNAGFLLVKTHDFYQSKRRTVAGRDERWRSSSAASLRVRRCDVRSPATVAPALTHKLTRDSKIRGATRRLHDIPKNKCRCQ